MRPAKRSENIPQSAEPTKIIEEKAVIGADGKYYKPTTYEFGDKYIRDDFGGHLYPDGGKLDSHFNAGKIIEENKISNKQHFFYRGKK